MEFCLHSDNQYYCKIPIADPTYNFYLSVLWTINFHNINFILFVILLIADTGTLGWYSQNPIDYCALCFHV